MCVRLEYTEDVSFCTVKTMEKMIVSGKSI